jgi:hypothetical protein
VPEGQGSPGVDLDRLLADTRRALAAVSGTGAPEAAEGVGTAAEERVRAVVRSPGRLTELEVDPRLMRLSAEELTEQIMAAVNLALDDLRDKATTAATPADLPRLGEQLATLHTDSVRQMERFTSSMSDAIARIRSGGA